MKWLFWNGSLKLIHSQSPPLIIACMINLSQLSYDNTIKYSSSVLSIVILVLYVIALVLEVRVIR